MLQGCTAAGDIAVITPYVGQLLRLRRAMAAQHMRVVISEQDQEAMTRVDDDTGDESSSNPAGGQASPRANSSQASPRPMQVAGGGGLDSSSSSSRGGGSGGDGGGSGAAGGGGGVVETKGIHECVRLATIDNFQVGACCVRTRGPWRQDYTAVRLVPSVVLFMWFICCPYALLQTKMGRMSVDRGHPPHTPTQSDPNQPSQGEEATVVNISLVRQQPGGHIGFLRTTPTLWSHTVQ